MSRASGQKDPGPRRAVVNHWADGGFFYLLSCDHIVEREPRVVARWRRPPRHLCCDRCALPQETRMPHPTYDDLALALWEILPHMADACRLLKDHGETEWADKVQALIDRHWDLGAPGAIVAHRRGLGGDGSSARRSSRRDGGA